MDLSDEWRSLWCIGSVFAAPALISASAAQAFGPLFFNPRGNPRFLYHRSSSIPKDEPFSHYSAPLSLLKDCVAQANKPRTVAFCGNRLESLRLGNDKLRLFFPDSQNGSLLRTLTLDTRDSTVVASAIAAAATASRHSILQLSAVGDGDDGWKEDDSASPVGFLLARTLYGVDWFKETELEGLSHVASASFGKEVCHVCCNPHVPEESAVILSDGELRLFDVSGFGGARVSGKRLPFEAETEKFEAVKLPIDSFDRKKLMWKAASELDVRSDGDAVDGSGWSCEFAWHPRNMLVASRQSVKLLDFRARRQNSSEYASVLANVKLRQAHCSASASVDSFLSLAVADFDRFSFAVGSRQHVFLYDSRRPVTPVLFWEHSMARGPNCLKFCRLQDLRGGVQDWATRQGKVILAASFEESEVRAFCYGPRSEDSSPFCSGLSDLPDPVYAWELPSKIVTVRPGNGLENHEYGLSFRLASDQDIPSNSHERLLGLCAISDQVLRPSAMENPGGRDLSGFALLQLMERGDVVVQRYQASQECSKRKPSISNVGEHLEIKRLPSKRKERKKKFPHIIRYLHTWAMHKESMESSIQSLMLVVKDESAQKNFGGIFRRDTCLFSIHEISSIRLWMSLPQEIFGLAFAKEIVRYKRCAPIFIQCSKSANSIKKDLLDLGDIENKIGESVDQYIWGPTLPLPYLLEKTGSSKGLRSPLQCETADLFQYILTACENFRQSGMVPEFAACSLSENSDACRQQDRRIKYMFLHKPSWDFLDDKDEVPVNNCDTSNILATEEEKEGIFKETMGKKEKENCFYERAHTEFIVTAQSVSFANDLRDSEKFDFDTGICPIALSFEERSFDLTADELKLLKSLKKKFCDDLQGCQVDLRNPELNLFSLG